ncbi:hypothetical protein SEA_CAFASSO_146 [Gordonia phage Cafasso]|uniref:Uncharacterized protein n=1 Tax=Gordonia phage Cafasso TaxID=2851095 RepID=A0AAE7VDY0_9CAUD|nr:hypothetical protein SEA_CAFASSO_146 [Gordonia phage Cafasso]
MDDVLVTEVKGVITTSDGRTREFSIVADGGWMQWGADREDCGNSVDALDAMATALLEGGHLPSE